MYRRASSYLAKWIESGGRKPLIVRGARQVGKSTLVRQFAEQQGLELFEINLEQWPLLEEEFRTFDLERILNQISAILRKPIRNSQSILFLDEIQACPHALTALRYFYEQRPDLAVISAGSLLEFALTDEKISVPVGRVEYLHLGPMSFEEYLIALKEDYLITLLADYKLGNSIPLASHQQLLNRQREFLFVGGMPEAVKKYVDSGDFSLAISAQQSIALTYQDDFAKYARKKDLLRLQKVFQYAARHIGQKVKYSKISTEDLSRDLKAALDLLTKAGIVYPVYHSDCSGLPIGAGRDERTYKLLFIDIGLMNRICGLDWMSILQLKERELVHEGPLAEQFVGQNLLYQSGGFERPELYYWLREKKAVNAEVDFVISRGDWIIPVEVKSGKSGSLKSLHQFSIAKQNKLALRFDLNPPSLQHMKTGDTTFDLISLPLYLVEQAPRIIDHYRMGS